MESRKHRTHRKRKLLDKQKATNFSPPKYEPYDEEKGRISQDSLWENTDDVHKCNRPTLNNNFRLFTFS